MRGWMAWGLRPSGVGLRWTCGFYHLYWRVLLPVSALLELAGFLIFLNSVRSHRPALHRRKNNEHMPVWILSVLVGTAGFGIALLINLVVAVSVSLHDTGPAFPLVFEARFLALVSYGFIVPTIWGFSHDGCPFSLALNR